MCKSFASHMQVMCKSYASHLQVICKTYASHMQVTCKSYASHAGLNRTEQDRTGLNMIEPDYIENRIVVTGKQPQKFDP